MDPPSVKLGEEILEYFYEHLGRQGGVAKGELVFTDTSRGWEEPFQGGGG